MDKSIEEILSGIKPVVVGQLPAFVNAIEPVIDALKTGPEDDIEIIHLILPHTANLIDIVRIGAGVDEAWLNEQPLDVLVQLGSKVLEENIGFFIERVLPVLGMAAETFNQSMTSLPDGSADSSTGALTTNQ